MCDIFFLQLNAITGARISIRTCNLVNASADCLSYVHVPALRKKHKEICMWSTSKYQICLYQSHLQYYSILQLDKSSFQPVSLRLDQIFGLRTWWAQFFQLKLLSIGAGAASLKD